MHSYTDAATFEGTENVHVGRDGADSQQPASSQLFSDPAALRAAPCTTATDIEFVPRRERKRTPETVVKLCGRCPLAAACLDYAAEHGCEGYWAGTTTRQRNDLAGLGLSGWQALRVAQLTRSLQGMPAASQAQLRQHPKGAGSLYRYRTGCRCQECLAASAETRSRRRAAARAAA